MYTNEQLKQYEFLPSLLFLLYTDAMKILLTTHLKRPVTPTITASRSRVIYDIAQGLIRSGHEVSVLSSGDSIIPGAHMINVIPKSIQDAGPYENEFYAHTAALTTLAKKIREIGNSYDIIHNHTYPEYINLLIANDIHSPIVTTIHGQPFAEFDEALSNFSNTFLISISHAHQKLFQKATIFRVVYNGIDTNKYTYVEDKEDYLLWLGRLSKAKNNDGTFQDPKGVRWAIQLAKETGQRLIMSGNVEDMAFFNQDVKPHLNDKIQWIGAVSSEHTLTKEQVAELMQKAKCFLMPINWYEPFGLVMAESMACGTPVIGFDRGAVKEVIKDGTTGFVVPHEDGIEGLKSALAKIQTIKPQHCRDHILENFSTEIMVKNYIQVYEDVIRDSKS